LQKNVQLFLQDLSYAILSLCTIDS